MTIWKKALSVGTSAALLASLLITAVAPAALASTAVTGVGTVGRGQTSTLAATFTFTESDINTLTAAGDFDVYIWDNSGSCAVAPGVGVNIAAATVHFVGAGTLAGTPDSLDASLTVADHSFNVDIGAWDVENVETVFVGGLQIHADSTAATGAIKACVYNDTGIFAAAFATGTVTAAGTLQSFIGTATTVNTTSACGFNAAAANATFGSQTDVDITAVAGTVPGVQAVTISAALTGTHVIGEAVSQTVPNCINNVTTLGSPGSVADSLVYVSPLGQYRLNPGETNQGPVFDLSASERTAGFLTVGSTITLTIATAGVTFSRAPNADVSGAGTLLTLTGVSTGSSNIFGVLAGDHKSVTWTVATKSGTVTPATGGAATITFDEIFYDVLSTVATGTSVDVTLATSAGVVVPTSRSNAVVGRVLTVTATTPTVYIGENNQTAGQVTIVETGPGFFIAGAGSRNTFAICLGATTNERFASAPWAKVTAGDLVLREGAVASTDKVVQGTTIIAGNPEVFECYAWTVWTASTTASTIVISGDEAGTTGVKINVPAGIAPGPVEAGIRTGAIASFFGNTTLEARVAIANRVFRNQVLVTALSQPVIPAGTGNALAGDIQIAETASGQLKDGSRICVEVLPRASNNAIQDTFLKGLTTADLPVAAASGGVVISVINASTQFCNGTDGIGGNASLIHSFSFRVNQQSITGLGKIVISNIHYGTTADAPSGPVLVNVWAEGVGNTNLALQGVVSNAKIGVKAAIRISAVSALGLRPNQGTWSTSTKVAAANKFITWRFAGGSALAGKTVRIYVATKNSSGGYGLFVNLTGRVADASGNAYFQWRSTGKWISVRAYYAGDISVAPSWSSPRQGRWL